MAKGVEPHPIQFADPGSDLAPIREEILAAVGKVLDGRQYILGPFVSTFEQELASRLGTAAAIGVASGTDALALTLQALHVGEGDEVITVSHTAGATVAAIRMVGATPVLVDVEEDTCCLDPKMLPPAYGPRTKAIVAVHLYGHPADMNRIAEFGRLHGIPIIEDCAQAQEATIAGRPVGSIGEVGCFSFFPTKILGAVGDAGAVATSDINVAERIRQLRTYGWAKPQFATLAGGRSSRLDALQAAILSLRLRHLTDEVERRRAIAREYHLAFADLPLRLPVERAGCQHVYHLYVVRIDRRDAFMAHLARDGIGAGIHYPFPAHVQPALAEGARVPAPLSVTEKAAQEIVTLPLFPSMSREQRDRVIASVRSYFDKG
jgi:dTDP-4-amino-4,6-dideoxygalactose transaminase